ncbi:MAG: methyl-accepting chemotaxis protein [Treponema sp.]|nr:methyl-accepting chemotaxis protein [Treponema sp.]
MGKTGGLTQVIGIIEEKCINCYACIAACPVKFCMDGSGEKLKINHDMCIGCGHCTVVCKHNARVPIDDTERFFKDIQQGIKMIAVAAPAIASVLPDEYLKLNGYLKSLGVEAVFDVSFGAELTVVSYLNHIKEKNPRLVIAQPCPAIVSFLEIYHPELLPYLAPADSPMLHTIKMIKEYYPKYKDYKTAVISPCIAKKREFDETGLGDYNITMLKLKEYLKNKNVNLSSFPAAEYIGAPAERAVTFSAPGGLLDTAERFLPGIRRKTRKIEGTHAIYPYLTGVSKQLNKPGIEFPLIIDCLNCELGCNGGPGTGNNHKDLDELESPIRKRSAMLEKKINPKQQESEYKKYHKILKRFWKAGLYNRNYVDHSNNYKIKYPEKNELDSVYKSLLKHSEADLFHCTSCGYGDCFLMATAIFNNLNKPDHCLHYTLSLLEKEKKTTVFINQQLSSHINRALEVIELIHNLVEHLDAMINIQMDAVKESSAVTGEMVGSLRNTSELSREKRESIQKLIDHASKGQEAMKETVSAVQTISESVEGIGSAIKIISVIAANTNLLSMNAAIEAAHAGEAGKGFAVVADEIRRLSESTGENSRNIAQTLSGIISNITTTSRRSGETGGLINTMASEINNFAQVMTGLIDTLAELSEQGTGITRSLGTLKENSDSVKTDYTKMMQMTDKLRYDINFLAAMSADIVKAIENNDQALMQKLTNQI